PLFPKQSYLVLEGSEKEEMFGKREFTGIQIALNRKSVFLGYLIALCLVAEIFSLLTTIYYASGCLQGLSDDWAALGIALFLSAFLFVAVIVLNRGLKATPKRALALAKEHGIDLRTIAERFAATHNIESILTDFEMQQSRNLPSN